MSNETTSAIERAAVEMNYGGRDDQYHVAAQRVLSAALTDPDDPDWLARTLFVLESCANTGISAEEALRWWHVAVTDVTRGHWRAVADGFRASILGTTP